MANLKDALGGYQTGVPVYWIGHRCGGSCLALLSNLSPQLFYPTFVSCRQAVFGRSGELGALQTFPLALLGRRSAAIFRRATVIMSWFAGVEKCRPAAADAFRGTPFGDFLSGLGNRVAGWELSV